MFHIFYCLNGVCAGELIDDENGGRNAVFTAEAGVALPGKLGSGDVLHSEDRAVRKGADDHVLELGWISESALNIDRILKLSARFGRWLSHLSGGRHDI